VNTETCLKLITFCVIIDILAVMAIIVQKLGT